MPINNCQYTLLVITSSFRDPEKILKTLREADFMLLEASNQQEAIQRIRTTSIHRFPSTFSWCSPQPEMPSDKLYLPFSVPLS